MLSKPADIREAENRGLEKAAVYLDERRAYYERFDGPRKLHCLILEANAKSIRAMKEET